MDAIGWFWAENDTWFYIFSKDNSATVLKNSKKPKTKAESFINDKGEFSMNWTRVSAEEVVMCPV